MKLDEAFVEEGGDVRAVVLDDEVREQTASDSDNDDDDDDDITMDEDEEWTDDGEGDDDEDEVDVEARFFPLHPPPPRRLRTCLPLESPLLLDVAADRLPSPRCNLPDGRLRRRRGGGGR